VGVWVYVGVGVVNKSLKICQTIIAVFVFSYASFAEIVCLAVAL